MLHQVYSNLEDSGGTPRLIPGRMRRCREWLVAASGVSGPDESEDREVRNRLRDVTYLRWSSPRPDSSYTDPVPPEGLGSSHPLFKSGSADGAVVHALQFLEGHYETSDGEVVWADVHPLDGARKMSRYEGLSVYAASGGTPPAVCYTNLNRDNSKLVRSVEFRIESGRADEYLPLADAVKVMSTRYWGRRKGFVQAAVVPFRPDDAPHVMVGEIHADFRHEPGGGIRVWPMDWNGLDDRPDYESAVEAAAEQVRGWRTNRARMKLDEPAPRAVGRLYRFGDGQHGLWPSRMQAVFEDGRCEWWYDPFEIDRDRASVRSYETL